jgi:hypothetical protein
MKIYWRISGFQDVQTRFYCGECHSELDGRGMIITHPSEFKVLFKTKPHPCRNAGKRIKSPFSAVCEEL